MSASPSTRTDRVRRIALSVVVLAFLAVGLVGLGPLLVVPFVAWLPEATIVRVLQFPPEDIHHLVHGVGIALGYGALLLCVAVQLRQPQRRVAPIWLATFIVLTQVVYDLWNGTVGDPIWWVVYVLFSAVVVLHPRRTAPITAVDRPAALLAVVGALCLAVYAWNQLQLQFGPEDPTGHVAANHYMGMAVAGGVIIVGAMLGATNVPGSRLVAWIAGVAAVLFSIASLAHPDHASAWPGGWAWAALVWGSGYVAVTVRRRPWSAHSGPHPAASDARAVSAGP